MATEPVPDAVVVLLPRTPGTEPIAMALEPDAVPPATAYCACATLP